MWRLECHIKAIKPLPESGKSTKLTNQALQMIEEAMLYDDETTTAELVTELQTTGVSVALSTALKGCRLLGWTSHGTAYC